MTTENKTSNNRSRVNTGNFVSNMNYSNNTYLNSSSSTANSTLNSVTNSTSKLTVNSTSKPKPSNSNSSPTSTFCLSCAQKHDTTKSENHIFDYIDESSLDELLICDICYQPFVQPLDLKCGHTFCSVCIERHLTEKEQCPICREPMNPIMDVTKSCIAMHKLCGQIKVYCPFEACRFMVKREFLASHLQQDCKEYTVYLESQTFSPVPKQRTQVPKSIKDDLILEVQLLKPESNRQKLQNSKNGKNKRKPSGHSPVNDPNSTQFWGLRFIGGKDTPIERILVQDGQNCEYLNTDGLQAGDEVISINNTSIPAGSINHEAFKQLQCVGVQRLDG